MIFKGIVEKGGPVTFSGRLDIFSSKLCGAVRSGPVVLGRGPVEQGQPLGALPVHRPAGGVQEAVEVVQEPEHHERLPPAQLVQALQAHQADAAQRHQAGARHPGNGRLPKGLQPRG